MRITACLAILGVGLACLPAAVRADTVYAVSFTTGELIRYDSADPAGTRTVLSGSGALVNPAALAIGPDGNLYVGEDGDGTTVAPRISRFEPATLARSTVVAFSDFTVFPGSLAFKGNDLLVGRNPFYGNTGAIVRVANATGGTVAVSEYTTGGNLASSPGLALAADGTLYVSDQTYDFVTGVASGPVKRFDAAGAYVGEVIASGSSGLSGPTGLVVSGSTLYTASLMAGLVLKTNLATAATEGFASAGGPFETGVLAQLADGSILAGSPSGSGSIYSFGTDGTLTSTFASGLGQIGGITVLQIPEPSGAALVAVAVACCGCRLVRRRSSCAR
jgi:hypothetical protein